MLGFCGRGFLEPAPRTTISLVTVVLGPLLAPLDPFARFAIVTPVMSALMTSLVMPGLSRLFRRFLYP